MKEFHKEIPTPRTGSTGQTPIPPRSRVTDKETEAELYERDKHDKDDQSNPNPNRSK